MNIIPYSKFIRSLERHVARMVRLFVVQYEYSIGYLTKAEAHDRLSGPLNPDDSSTVVDDSKYLKVKK